MLIKFGSMLVILFLVSCTNAGSFSLFNSGPLASYKAVLTACSGYATTLTVLALHKRQGKMSVEQIGSVDVARALGNSVCDRDEPPLDISEALDIIEDVAFELLVIKAIVEN